MGKFSGWHSVRKFIWRLFGIILLIACCAVFIGYRYSIVINYQYFHQIEFLENEREFKSMRRHGYLIDSDTCHISDLDPYHPTVREFIKREDPISCLEYAPLLTYSDEEKLFLNSTYFPSKNNTISCCFRGIYRVDEDDNSYRFGEDCIEFFDSVTIKEDSIKVECSENGSVIYQNFHSFVHENKDVEDRCNKANSETKSDQSSKYGVLLIGIDAMSRINSHRQLTKTIKFLKDKMNAIEMYGFNKVGDNTFPNVVPVLSGYHDSELPYICFNESKHEFFDKCNFVWKLFAERGYRTLYAEDCPHISTFNYLKKGFLKRPTDYYFRNFILPFQKTLGWKKPLNCDLCVGTISEVQATLDWVSKFISRFHHKPTFAFAWTNSLTHDFVNLGSAGDHLYHNFFKTLYDKNLTENHFIIVMGDHGMRWGSIRNTYIGRLEERLPMLYIAVPPSFEKEHPSETYNLKMNSERLVTPFDLYATLIDILKFDGYKKNTETSVPNWIKLKAAKRAISLFESISRNRTCQQAGIPGHFCTCQQWKEVSKSNTEVIHTVEYLITTINSKLKHYNQCSELSLKEIISSRERAPDSHLKASNDSDIYDYQVTIKTKPGNSIFEGSARFVSYKHTHELLGNISRINLYGNQSWCVDDSDLKKFCYCKIQLR